MAKLAVLGRVKTRLGREIGAVEALRFYRATRQAVFLRLHRDPRFQIIAAVDPATERDRSLPRGIRQVGQTRADLGRRMEALLRARGSLRNIVIGTDIPGITATHIADAAHRLRGASAIIGPAGDGGFWLYGARASPRRIIPFDTVRWSHPETLSDVQRNLRLAPLAFAATLSDVDTRADHATARDLIGRVVLPRTVR
jgi:uncharacterized protein